jgi:hypothetical protein
LNGAKLGTVQHHAGRVQWQEDLPGVALRSSDPLSVDLAGFDLAAQRVE